MPQVLTSDKVQAYAHCPRPMCEGAEQMEIEAIREEIGTTYQESGGDLPFIEKSTVHLTFADPKLAECPICGHPRDISLQSRVEYQNLSGHDPNGLIGIKYGPQSQEDTPEAALQARIKQLEAELEIGKS